MAEGRENLAFYTVKKITKKQKNSGLAAGGTLDACFVVDLDVIYSAAGENFRAFFKISPQATAFRDVLQYGRSSRECGVSIRPVVQGGGTSHVVQIEKISFT